MTQIHTYDFKNYEVLSSGVFMVSGVPCLQVTTKFQRWL